MSEETEVEASKPEPVPEINLDVEKIAKEIEYFIDLSKYDLINADQTDVVCFPPGNDKDNYPEIAKLSVQFKAVFDWAEVHQDDQPKDLENAMDLVEDCIVKIQEKINENEEFWAKIREVVIPLYQPAKFEKNKEGKIEMKEEGDNDFADRWRSVRITYDPDTLTVKTTHRDHEGTTIDVKEEEMESGLNVEIY